MLVGVRNPFFLSVYERFWMGFCVWGWGFLMWRAEGRVKVGVGLLLKGVR